jgi:hypothetical protein
MVAVSPFPELSAAVVPLPSLSFHHPVRVGEALALPHRISAHSVMSIPQWVWHDVKIFFILMSLLIMNANLEAFSRFSCPE